MTNDQVTTEVSSPKQNSTAALSPGAQLRRAREAAKMDRQAVARQLYLTEQIIAAIEQDDFNKMPGFTFVKGYLRAYAKLVNLSADSVIEAFNGLGLIDSKATPNVQVPLYKANANVVDRYIPSVTYGLIFGLVVLLLLWWHSQKPNQAAATVAASQGSAIEIKQIAEASAASTAAAASNADTDKTTQAPSSAASANPVIASTDSANANSQQLNDTISAPASPPAHDAALPAHDNLIVPPNNPAPVAAKNPAAVQNTQTPPAAPSASQSADPAMTRSAPVESASQKMIKPKKNKKAEVLLKPPFE